MSRICERCIRGRADRSMFAHVFSFAEVIANVLCDACGGRLGLRWRFTRYGHA